MCRTEKMILMILILFLVQNPLSQVIGAFDYLDEGLTIIGYCVLIYRMSANAGKTVKIRCWKVFLMIGILFIIILGLCGNIALGFQKILYVLLDIFAFSKFFVGLLLGLTISVEGYTESFEKAILHICKFVAVLQFGLAVHDQLFLPWFDYLSEWNYIRSIKLYYSNQTYLVGYGVFVLALLMMFSKSKAEQYFYGGLLIIPIILTMRSKAWGFLLLFLVVNMVTKKVRMRNPIILGSLCLPLILYVAWDKIELYFFTSTHYSPRLIILQDGLMLAGRYFPIGTGFGTYCSPGAALGGSPVYDMLGTNYSSEYISDAINDMYWGYMLGQFGFLGTLLMIFILIVLTLEMWKIQTRSRPKFLAGICLVLYLIVASIGESPFFASYGIGYAYLIGKVLREADIKHGEASEACIKKEKSEGFC